MSRKKKSSLADEGIGTSTKMAPEDKDTTKDEAKPDPKSRGGKESSSAAPATVPSVKDLRPDSPKPRRTRTPKPEPEKFEPVTGDEELPARQAVKGKREVSIFDKKPQPPPEPARPTAAPGPPRPASAPRPDQVGGDTLQMKAVAFDPEKPAVSRVTPGRPTRAPQTGPRPAGARVRTSRVAELRRREYTPRHRFGFFSFIFGFVGLIFKMIFVTLLVLALGMFVSYEVIRTYVRTEEVVVPNIKGMKVLDAMKLLSGEGKKELGLIQERAEASGFVAPGEIIEQKPAAGTTVKKGSPVRVTVSSGRARLQVPEVVRESLDNATNKIKGAGLEVGDIIRVENEQVPKDHVISQSPEGGKGLDESVKVDLMVSKGPRGNSLTMPDVTGMSVADARSRLSTVGISNVVVDPPGANGIVREQQPLVGKIVQQTQQITLRVGDAAAAATAPLPVGATPAVTVR